MHQRRALVQGSERAWTYHDIVPISIEPYAVRLVFRLEQPHAIFQDVLSELDLTTIFSQWKLFPFGAHYFTDVSRRQKRLSVTRTGGNGSTFLYSH